MSTFLQINRIVINGTRYESVATKNDHIVYLPDIAAIHDFSVELVNGYNKGVVHSFLLITNYQGMAMAARDAKADGGTNFQAFVLMPPKGDLPREWLEIIHENRKWFRRSIFLMMAPTLSSKVSIPIDGIVLEPLSKAIKPIWPYLSFAYAIISILCALTCGALVTMSYYGKLSYTITYILIGLAFVGKFVYSFIFVNNKGFSPTANTIFVILVALSPFLEIALYQITYWPLQNGRYIVDGVIYTMVYCLALFLETFFPLEKSQLTYRGKTMVFIWSDTKDHAAQKAIEARYGSDKMAICTWLPTPGKASLYYPFYWCVALFWRIFQGFSLERRLNDHAPHYFASVKSFVAYQGPLKPYVWVVRRHKGDDYGNI